MQRKSGPPNSVDGRPATEATGEAAERLLFTSSSSSSFSFHFFTPHPNPPHPTTYPPTSSFFLLRDDKTTGPSLNGGLFIFYRVFFLPSFFFCNTGSSTSVDLVSHRARLDLPSCTEFFSFFFRSFVNAVPRLRFYLVLPSFGGPRRPAGHTHTQTSNLSTNPNFSPIPPRRRPPPPQYLHDPSFFFISFFSFSFFLCWVGGGADRAV